MGVVPPSHMFDATMKLQNAGAVASSAASTNIIDLEAGAASGAPVGRRVCKVVIDYSALNIDTNDEIYDLVIQGSSDAAFGTDTNIVELAAISLGHATPKRTDSNIANAAAGRREIFFSNVKEDGTPLRYIRGYWVIAGTGKSITFGNVYLVPLDIAA